jgi:hypothetical protein
MMCRLEMANNDNLGMKRENQSRDTRLELTVLSAMMKRRCAHYLNIIQTYFLLLIVDTKP